MYLGGCSGNILPFNPSDQTANRTQLPPEIHPIINRNAESEIKDLFDPFKAGSGSFGAVPPFIFSTGPYASYTIPYLYRMTFGTELPLSGTMLLAFQGGYFPVQLKYAVYDAAGIEAPGKTLQTKEVK